MRDMAAHTAERRGRGKVFRKKARRLQQEGPLVWGGDTLAQGIPHSIGLLIVACGEVILTMAKAGARTCSLDH